MGRSSRFHPRRLRGVGVGFGVLAISILAIGAALSAPTARAAPADNPPGCVLTLVGTKLVCLPTPTPPVALPVPTPTPTAKPAPAPTPTPCVLGLVGNCIVGGNPPPPVGSGPPSGGQGCTLNVLNAACVGTPGGAPVTLGPSGSGSGGPGGGGQGSPGTCLPGNLACTCPAGASVGQACSTGPASGGAVGTAGGLTAASGASGLTIPLGPPLPGTSGSSFPAAAASATTASSAGNGGLSHPAVTATRDLGPFSGLDLSNLALWPLFLVLDALALAGLFLLLRRSWSTRPAN